MALSLFFKFEPTHLILSEAGDLSHIQRVLAISLLHWQSFSAIHERGKRTQFEVFIHTHQRFDSLLVNEWYWKLLSTPRYHTHFIKSVWTCIFGWYCRSRDELKKVLGSGQVLKWHELQISWIAKRICSSPPQIMWPVWEKEFLTSESRFEKKWKWSPDNWNWIWESESEFEKANRGARASRSNSTLFALLTHFLPRKRDSSKSILCHTQMRPSSSTQSFSLFSHFKKWWSLLCMTI